jgi:exodeoxyribonuclease V alpha subunit
MLLDEYRVYLENIVIISKDNRDFVKVLLKQFNQFKILCAIREGYWGVTGLNNLAKNVLSNAGLIQLEKTHYQHGNEINTSYWYVGRPVMITKNSYHLGLYNGDIGLCLKDENQQLRVYFQKADSTIVDFLPSRLPSHETVFAMTVHKSQGSEFSHTVLALPEQQVPVVTRELIYTGITRAKNKLTLFADLNMLSKAVAQKTVRYSGLVERLKSG